MIRARYGQAEELREVVHPIHGVDADWNPVLERIGDASVVLLGEATHGTHEFYHARSLITQRLIEEKGFEAVAVEADWPDAYRVNRYVQGMGRDEQAVEALGDFERFPTWMWRNADVLDLVGWLRDRNMSEPAARRVGFYGLDLYGLHASIDAVLRYLEAVDPLAAERARSRYSCFDHANLDPQRYGYATTIGARPNCEREAMQQLLELQRRAAEYVRRDGLVAADEQFFAEQNAWLVVRAEHYYRAMFGNQVSAWNLRDKHMADTLTALVNHLRGTRGAGKVVVWAHNSHIGDARATDMAQRRELNLGQLARQYYGEEAVIVGFTTYQGTVSAASNWGEPVERKVVRPALHESCESLLHEVGERAFVMRTDEAVVRRAFAEPRLERMIGVIYRPETERQSHYFQCRLAEQMDVVVHYDHSRAVEPLEPTERWHRGETPETYPSGL